MVDVSSGRKVKRPQLLPALNALPSDKNFFNTTLEDVYKQKYGGRYPPLTENVASGIGTGLKAVGVPKYTAENVGRNVTHLAEDWTPLGALPAVEKGGPLGAALGIAGLIPMVGKGERVAVKAAEDVIPMIRAYHGSPHSFPAEPGAPLGRFRDTAIGTGEGAQAYGRGHYLAEQEKTAQAYRKNLSGPNPDYEGGIAPELKQALRDEDNLGFDTMGEALTAIRNHPDWAQRWDVSNPERLQQLFEAHDAAKYGGRGHMYEVNIAADPAHFLDWDKPLSEQSSKVREALGFSTMSKDQLHNEAERLFQQHGPFPQMPPEIQARVGQLQDMLDKSPPDISGADYYRGATDDLSSLVSQLRGAPQGEQSKALLEKGIPGIKYLDQGSRGVGEGSRNYVVFSPEIIEIVKKYGIVGALGLGLISQQDAKALAAQGVGGTEPASQPRSPNILGLK